ncbi:sensor histidine kinase [Bdellovibrio sp. HCB117]|uniref:sensor histidine kinase n=1 Tax=Bdellovibrio sp. HCB117 TaxID=3394359 RepID=UPI0039B3F0AE
MSYLDALFLDLRGYLSRFPIHDSDVVEISISSLKEKNPTIPINKLQQLVEKIEMQKAKKIILAISPGEILASEEELDRFEKRLEKLSNVYLYSRWGAGEGRVFATSRHFDEFSRHLIHKFHLNVSDQRTRKLVFSMDGIGLDSDLKDFLKVFELPNIDLDKAQGVIDVLGTKQVYIKFYSADKLGTFSLDTENLVQVRDKIVIISSEDHHSGAISTHQFARFSFSEDATNEGYFSEGKYLITIVNNIKNTDWIKEAKASANFFWIFFVISLELFLLRKFYHRPALFVAWSFIVPTLAFLLSLAVFRFYSLNLDFSRILVGGLIIQYLGIPILFIVSLRSADRKLFEESKKSEREKLQARIMVKAATTEATLRMVGQVSHDIRSPLMALQVASSLLKGQVSGDLRDLIENATQRIRNISEDLFQRYKTKGSDLVQGDTSLKAALSELISSYEKVHEKARFLNQVPSDVIVYWPLYAIQRSFSNLLNNSLEACYAKGIDPVIEISAEKQAGIIVIYLKDNGPGIPAEHVRSLFKEGSTFNKKGGTGLGLYQVKKDLELTGGVVSYIPSAQGACFKIVVPMALEAVRFGVSESAVIVTAEDSASLQKRFEDVGIKVSSFSTLSKAKEFLIANPEKNLTLIADLLFPGEEETGFDLLDSLPQKHLYKAVLCTSLVESSDIQELANKKGALLVRRSFFDSIQIAKAKA